MMINIYAAWIAFFAGCIAGAIPGLFFHRPEWLGGYVSWPRRMIRLGHISFFGLGALNLGFALTSRALDWEAGLEVASILLVVGAATMPLVCYLIAAWPKARQAFCIPAGSITVAMALVLWRLIAS